MTHRYVPNGRRTFPVTGFVERRYVDTSTYLAVDGCGKLGGRDFLQLRRCLLTMAYTLKLAHPDCEFQARKLQMLHLSPPNVVPKRWRLMVELPETLGPKAVAAAGRRVRDQKGLDVTQVKYLRWREGAVLEVVHEGPPEEVEYLHERMQNYAASGGMLVSGPLHEIHLNGRGRGTRQTALRLPILDRR